uniref:Transposase n=1 Tax=Globodera rostochiensis TaxID=31243 RepID=A0A914HK08_GLORO
MQWLTEMKSVPFALFTKAHACSFYETTQHDEMIFPFCSEPYPPEAGHSLLSELKHQNSSQLAPNQWRGISFCCPSKAFACIQPQNEKRGFHPAGRRHKPKGEHLPRNCAVPTEVYNTAGGLANEYFDVGMPDAFLHHF